MKTRRLFNYPGTKRAIAGKVSSVCAKLKFQNASWLEPFCGSASLFYNLDFKLAEAHLNDLDSHVMQMHQACKDFRYADYLDAVHQVDKQFGDIKTDHDAYYSYRKWWNEEGSKTP